jgi:hypothetical protein
MEARVYLPVQAALRPKKERRYPLDRRLDDPQSSCREQIKSLEHVRNRTSIPLTQPLARRYTAVVLL